jgi:RNA polymerase sigma factor (sigma-70 family)
MVAMASFDSDDDADLLAYVAMVAEDRENALAAYAAFYERHAEWLLNVIARPLGHDDDLAADIVQETFRRVFESGAATYVRPSGNGEAQRKNARAWLARIAKRALASYFRERGPLVAVDELEGEEAVAPEALEEDESALVLRAREELDALTDDERDIMLSWLYEYRLGASHQRVPNDESRALAERLRTTPENIRQRRKRILERLKRTLTPAAVALESQR